MNTLPSLAAAGLAAALLMSPPVRAGDGHDHGNAAPAPTGQALPRFAAVSDAFELVGVLQGRQITLYLDRAADNAPVTDARIELEIAGARLKAVPHDGAYEATLAEPPKPGVLPVTATVTAGQETDLLAGELDLHEDTPAAEAAHAPGRREIALWAASGLGVVGTLAWIGRRRMAARQRNAGATA